MEIRKAELTQKDSTILLAIDGQTPIGFIQRYSSFSSVTMRRICILNDLFIDPSARRRGAAAALLKSAEDFAEQSGAVRLTLATEATNKPAQALYEKLGWEKNKVFLHYNKSV